MVEKNILNKIIFIVAILLLMVFIIYVLNHTISAYKYIYKNYNVINNLSEITYATNHTIIYDDKIDGKWLHHINNIEQVKKFENKYESFELDILFYNNDLYVAHDKTELHQNITLKDYLAIFDNLDNRKFWLDIKNMDNKNYSSILTILDDLVENINNGGGILYKSNIIIESGNLEALKLMFGTINIYKARYNLSWYFPYLDLSHEDTLITTINNLVKEIDGNYFDYVSSDIKYYKVLEKVFPNKEKLFWYTGGCVIERKYKRMLLYNYVNKDKNTKILLYPACS